jgi:hypothetical protein
MRFLLTGVLIALWVPVSKAATDVELVDCNFTPEVKRELRLTAEQQPKVEKVISEIGPMTSKTMAARVKRDNLRKSNAPAEEIEAAQKELIELERQCGERSHELLEPILTEAQFKKIEEMEAVHGHRISGQQGAEHSAHGN